MSDLFLTSDYSLTHPSSGPTFGVHRRQMLEGVADIFDKNQKHKKQAQAETNELYRQIGKLKVENDFLSRKLVS